MNAKFMKKDEHVIMIFQLDTSHVKSQRHSGLIADQFA